MSKTKKGIAIFCGMVLAISLLFPCTVMKAKAEGTATANLTINFVESIDSANVDGSTTKEVTITNFVDNGNGSYSGTIDLSNEGITYEKGTNDTRYVVAWYNGEKSSSLSPKFSLENVTVTDSDSNKVYEITLYAVYGKAVQITFNNNYANYGGSSYSDNITVSQYYPQKDSGEASETITLPTDPSGLNSNFMINGYVFKGWGAQASGETQMVSSAALNYGESKTYYAYWEETSSGETTFSESGQYNLAPNTKYTLGDGTWTVNGGTTKYPANTVFYVETAGTYTLTKQ